MRKEKKMTGKQTAMDGGTVSPGMWKNSFLMLVIKRPLPRVTAFISSTDIHETPGRYFLKDSACLIIPPPVPSTEDVNGHDLLSTG